VFAAGLLQPAAWRIVAPHIAGRRIVAQDIILIDGRLSVPQP
jgi:hypothetical protein